MSTSPIYFDNAATSWPKPPCVQQAMSEFITHIGANPGRGAHDMAVQAARVVYQTRQALAQLFHVENPLQIIFTKNATEALNLALTGLLQPGDHVITSSMEHNAMMRPLRELERNGVELTVIPCAADGSLDPVLVEKAIQPQTKLIAITHASNVCGTLLPVAKIGSIARQHHLYFLVDAAQTAGAVSIDMQKDSIDLLAFTGHKSLLGPTGTGGLVIGERVNLQELRPFMRGGTGSQSELEEQPDFLPDKYESGTLNTIGLAGLNAGVRWLLKKSIKAVREEEETLLTYALQQLLQLENLHVLGTQQAHLQSTAISFNVENYTSSEIGVILDEHHIMTRVGLHCAPAAHKTLGTFPHGTVRFGLGIFNTPQQIDAAVTVLRGLL